MEQYIPKSVLVTKIERLMKHYDESAKEFGDEGYCDNVLMEQCKANTCKHILSFIGTLEAKEDKEDSLLTEGKTEKELAESYINLFDKKFGNKLPNLKGKQLAEFKNLINTCEQTFYMKYFDYHATQGKLFEKLALLWAAWGKEHLSLEVKEVGLEKEINNQIRLLGGVHTMGSGANWYKGPYSELVFFAKHFFELGIKTLEG